MCVSTKEECITDEEDEGGQVTWQGKTAVICPSIPEEEHSTPVKGVHDENGTMIHSLFCFFKMSQIRCNNKEANVSP